jgi:hypothetical protein
LRLVLPLALIVAPGIAHAFHSGGVADCEGCHSMHNSFEGSENILGAPQYAAGPYLLKSQDQSGACLNCHHAADTVPTSYHISTAGVTPGDRYAPGNTPVEMTPGGDFAWLKKTMCLNPVYLCERGWSPGERKGHNIVAADFGYGQDTTQIVAPGGSYPASNLACSSCHDPHGRYRRFADGSMASTGLPIFNSGSYTTSNAPIASVSAVGVYRLLAGIGYQPKSLAGSFAFVNKSPDAVAQSSYNGVNTTIQGSYDTVAYGQGMSEWCANCHAAMVENGYSSGMKGLVHPAGNAAHLTAPIVGNYTAYVSSGIMSGTGAGYSALAPFEQGTADYTVLKVFPTAPTPPTTSSNVLCLSCHRAHASAFESMTRYYLGNEFMTVADSGGNAVYDSSITDTRHNGGYSVTQQTNAYNGRPAAVFGPWARNYCNKCHAKD